MDTWRLLGGYLETVKDAKLNPFGYTWRLLRDCLETVKNVRRKLEPF